MASKQPKRERILKRTDPAPEPDLSDDAVIAELVADASDRDLARLLHEFPRESDFVLAIYAQFLERGSTWSQSFRAQLAEALARCRLHEEADMVRNA